MVTRICALVPPFIGDGDDPLNDILPPPPLPPPPPPPPGLKGTGVAVGIAVGEGSGVVEGGMGTPAGICGAAHAGTVCVGKVSVLSALPGRGVPLALMML